MDNKKDAQRRAKVSHPEGADLWARLPLGAPHTGLVVASILSMKTLRFISTIFILGATTLLLARVSTDYDHAADWSRYRSFSWIKVQAEDPLWNDRISAAVNGEQLLRIARRTGLVSTRLGRRRGRSLNHQAIIVHAEKNRPRPLIPRLPCTIRATVSWMTSITIGPPYTRA